MSNFDIDNFFNVSPAAQPGRHAPAGFVSSEYDESIVADQIAYLERGERMSFDEMEALQTERLRELLVHAGTHVPYWRRLFRDIGFLPGEINSTADLSRLPLLTKDMIKADYKSFISEALNPSELTYMTTGGSTGAPLKILMDREYRSRNHAATRYYLSKAGITPGKQRSVRLHGNTMPEEVLTRGEYWLVEGNRLTMSVYHISPTTCPAYMEAIRSFNPVYIHAYASALSLLASYAERQNERFPDSVISVFCDSETTYPWQRDLIQRTTGAQLFNIYGHTEGAGMAITFPDSTNLEALSPIGIMELLDDDRRAVRQAGERGEIVVTGFNNKIMPFIRYRTFDMAVIGSVSDKSSRPFQPVLSNVEGRLQDYLVADDGRLVPAAPPLFDYNFDWSGIEQFQVVQELPGVLEFRVVPDSAAAVSADVLCRRVVDGFSEILGEGFSVKAIPRSTLACTNRGKFRYIDQKLKIDA